MLILSALACAAVAAFCFINGLPLSGVLMLAGMIPGLGTLPLIAAGLLLAVGGHPVVALFPALIIAYNFWVLFVLNRQT